MARNSELISFNDLKSQYQAYIASENLEDNAENFKHFLSLHKSFSTKFSDELYAFYSNTVDSNDDVFARIRNDAAYDRLVNSIRIKMRKTSRRPSITKKTALYTALSGSIFGGLIGGLRAQTLVAGSKFLGFIPVTTSVALNTIPAVAVGLAAGAAVTFAAIKVKDAIVKAHYNRKYGTIKNNFIGKSSSLEDLITKVEETNQEIRELKQQGGFINWIKRTAKNVINRNRLHHIMKCRKELAEAYAAVAKDRTISDENRKTLITSHGDRLDKINDLIKNDIKTQKSENKDKFIHSLISGKRLPKIENIDIYGDSEIQCRKVLKAALGETDSTRRNYRNKVSEARKIFRRGSSVENLLERLYHRNIENRVIGDHYLGYSTSTQTYLGSPAQTENSIIYLPGRHNGDEVNPDLETPLDQSSNSSDPIIVNGNSNGNSQDGVDSNGETEVKPERKKSDDYIASYIITRALLQDEKYIETLNNKTQNFATPENVENLIKKLTKAIESGKRMRRSTKNASINDLYDVTFEIAKERQYTVIDEDSPLSSND